MVTAKSAVVVHAYGIHFAGGRCCSERKLIAGENSQGASAGTRFHLFAVAYNCEMDGQAGPKRW